MTSVDIIGWINHALGDLKQSCDDMNQMNM